VITRPRTRPMVGERSGEDGRDTPPSIQRPDGACHRPNTPQTGPERERCVTMLN
jgi:hypothetical protein